MNLSEKRPNKWWTEPDTFAMLTLIEQLDLVRELDKKRQRNESHFRRLRQSLAKRDIHFTVNQIRNRWKSLKHKYRKIKLATYRSPAARLSAMESFRYFRRLDRMLACRPRSGGPEEGECSLVGQSDLEDHTNILGDVGQSCPVAPWSGGASLESETESIAPKLESSADEEVNAEELARTEHPSWAAGSHEVMTLGLSGEYLYAVKTEPHSDLNPVPTVDRSSEATDSRQTAFPGTSEDICTLILQQLTILNHQLEEQLAEQRAFHCSMLGMMDRQIEVLEQLSSFTQSHCRQPKPEPSETDSSINQKVHETLLRILRGMENQVLQPCLSRPPPSTPPPWTVSLVEVHKSSSSVDVEVNNEAENSKSTDGCKHNSSSLPASELLSSSPINGTLQNGLC
ncbi:uncharacterized protein si:ch211-116o3.5 [Colossoma macropomum]|uniref:uncharacterized protein si:ch211-116o3.5 n=1 Tax=Colossoma macropomum TaxID=42526 RepID=UPI0018647D85|nr:uncharacterized protein si:ch211-116o3.5 [Colossoma macropomum]XP_036413611.1 uncharacterized protein si:ch211-116o3.5 [Colossoma macropomum]